MLLCLLGGVNPSKGCCGSAVVCMFCGHFVVKAPNVQVILAKSKKPKNPKNKQKTQTTKQKNTKETEKKTKNTTKKTHFRDSCTSDSPFREFWISLFFGFLFLRVFCLFIITFVFLFVSVFGFCQYYLYVRNFDHEMTAKHANNCTPRVARSEHIMG